MGSGTVPGLTDRGDDATGAGLAGRERELGRVEAFLEAGTAGARGLVIRGEAGIGKTALWRAALERVRAAAGAVVLVARPAEEESPASLVGLLDLFDTVDPEPAVLDPDTDVFERGRATLRTLRRLTADAHVVLAIDDEQWLDAVSARALRYALRRLDDRPVRVFATHRTGELDDFLLLPREHTEDLHLGPLSIAALRQALRPVVTTIGRPSLEAIHHLSGGNPMYALELARVRDRAPQRAPASLSGTLSARLVACPPSIRAIVETAAALGPVSPERLQAACRGSFRRGRRRRRTRTPRARRRNACALFPPAPRVSGAGRHGTGRAPRPPPAPGRCRDRPGRARPAPRSRVHGARCRDCDRARRGGAPCRTTGCTERRRRLQRPQRPAHAARRWAGAGAADRGGDPPPRCGRRDGPRRGDARHRDVDPAAGSGAGGSVDAAHRARLRPRRGDPRPGRPRRRVGRAAPWSPPRPARLHDVHVPRGRAARPTDGDRGAGDRRPAWRHRAADAGGGEPGDDGAPRRSPAAPADGAGHGARPSRPRDCASDDGPTSNGRATICGAGTSPRHVPRSSDCSR